MVETSPTIFARYYRLVGCAVVKFLDISVCIDQRARVAHPLHQLFRFLMTEANAIVAPTNPNGMPVILTTPAEVDQWLEADIPGALALQRPLPDDALRIVAKGEKEDSSAEVTL
jgi:putative SOS response-associated peptidase YedK